MWIKNVTIQNQHIPCRARKQRDKINKLQRAARQADRQINRQKNK